MALEKLAKIPSLVRKAGQSASKAQPFYSNVDQAIANITQGTGTGAQMLAELLKTKGVAKELKDRPAIKKTLEANKDAKVTKADLERLAAENPPPQIDETALGGKQNYSDAEIEREYRRIYGNPYTSDGERIGIEEMRDAVISSTAGVDSSFAPKYAKHTIPGGENYREILIKLPERFNTSAEKIEFEKLNRQMMEDGLLQDDMRRWEELGQRLGAEGRDANPAYLSSHFDEPNILAHARVTDRVGPNGEKILHVEEIQSDWHQAGRKKGYKTPDIEVRLKESEKEMEQIGMQIRAINNRMAALSDNDLDEFNKLAGERQALYDRQGFLMDEGNALIDKRAAAVPDAPFKQNWHELVMKRLLDDAARNGYDKVVITPGAEQSKRYDLSKQISKVQYDPNEKTLYAYDKNGREVISERGVEADQLDDYIGKEPAEKLRLEANNATSVFNEYEVLRDPESGKYGLYLYGEPSYDYGGEQLLFDSKAEARDHLRSIIDEGISSNMPTISGLDLRVGGEGMKGFYDQILPSYLNDYGKRYGVQVGTYEMPVGEKMIPDRAGLGMIRSGEQEMAPFHSFDITPQMREDITTKGVPLYQAAPPVAIGAGAMQEEQPAEYAGGGIIKKAGQIIGKAAQSSGMARPVTATKDLTTLQDFHTSLGDRIRERVAERQNLIESMPFKYDKGQRVFTEDSARKNWLPYEILDRTLFGNRPMRADHPVLGPGMGAVIRDPETGKAMRTPYEAGYRVRHETPEGWQEYVLPETAIKGDVEMAGGGAVRKALKAVLPKGQQAVLSAEESAENLQKFLGNSRVRDTLYHATPKSFSAFKPGGDDPTLSGPAIWLTPNAKSQPAAHNIGGGERGFKEGTNVMPVYAQARSPLLLDDRLAIEWARDVFAGGSREFPDLIHPKTVEELKKSGYDSIIHADPYGNRGGEQEIIMFEPNKIKSAIGNRGTYDITDPDINKAGGGIIKKAAKALLPKGQQAILPAAESVANLDKFLADSVIKKRLYHGTSQDFPAYSHAHQYSGEGATHTGSGFYFTDNPESASRFAEVKGTSGANVQPVYLSIKNPLEFDWGQGETTGAKINLSLKQVKDIIQRAPNIKNPDESPLVNWGDIRGGKFDAVLNEAAKSYAESSMLAALRNDFFPDSKSWLEALSKATGHDSAMTVTPSGDTHYIAWFPEQIKSAIGNVGEYDITNPDITKAKGGRVTNDAMWMAVQNKQLRKKHGN